MADVNRAAGGAIIPSESAGLRLAGNEHERFRLQSFQSHVRRVRRSFRSATRLISRGGRAPRRPQESAEESQKNLEESIRIEVSQAYDAYQGALTALPVAKDTLDRAAKSLDLFRPLYHSGRQSIIEVLRAEEGLAKAQAAYLQALFQAHIAYLRLAGRRGQPR